MAGDPVDALVRLQISADDMFGDHWETRSFGGGPHAALEAAGTEHVRSSLSLGRTFLEDLNDHGVHGARVNLKDVAGHMEMADLGREDTQLPPIFEPLGGVALSCALNDSADPLDTRRGVPTDGRDQLENRAQPAESPVVTLPSEFHGLGTLGAADPWAARDCREDSDGAIRDRATGHRKIEVKSTTTRGRNPIQPHLMGQLAPVSADSHPLLADRHRPDMPPSSLDDRIRPPIGGLHKLRLTARMTGLGHVHGGGPREDARCRPVGHGVGRVVEALLGLLGRHPSQVRPTPIDDMRHLLIRMGIAEFNRPTFGRAVAGMVGRAGCLGLI